MILVVLKRTNRAYIKYTNYTHIPTVFFYRKLIGITVIEMNNATLSWTQS